MTVILRLRVWPCTRFLLLLLERVVALQLGQIQLVQHIEFIVLEDVIPVKLKRLLSVNRVVF